MRILALSDRPEEYIYTPEVVEHFPAIDLLVGCGDLPEYYLEFLVSIYNVPLVYVPGNHDRDQYVIPGGLDADGRILQVKGLRILGLGGSRRYKPRGTHQYTDSEMCFRVASMLLRLLIDPLAWRRGAEVIVSHAPPRGIHDSDDLPHRGFSCFHPLLRIARPRLMLHGHSHIFDSSMRSETSRYGARIMNVFPYRLIELPELG
jgi:hypothetical protein